MSDVMIGLTPEQMKEIVMEQAHRIQDIEVHNAELREGIETYFNEISHAVSGVGIVKAEGKLKALARKALSKGEE